MSDDIASIGASIGDGALAGLAAHALEPGGGAGHASHAARCLNCGSFLTGPYCSGCGQPGHLHRSIGAFWHDLLHGVLHFEGKLWRTLPMLFARPGELTRRYIHGERARFFSPLALFLFAVFLTFAVFSIFGVGLNGASGGIDPLDPAQRQATGARISDEMAQQLRQTEARLTAARNAGQPTAAIERELQQQQEGAAVARRLFGFGESSDGQPASGVTFNVDDMDTGIPLLNEMIVKLNHDPALMLYKLQSNAYKFAWVLIPLSAPFVWILFPFSRRFGFYDHLVFVTYSLSFMLLLLVGTRVAAAMGMSMAWVAVLLVLYPVAHLYWQIRGAYRTSRIGAMLRASVLSIVAVMLLMLFMTGLLALGAIG